MLGVYENFPADIHKTINFETSISETSLQKALIDAFYVLNNKTLTFEEVAYPSLSQCIVGFEFGIAEENDFNFLDTHERDRIIAAIQKKPFSSLDFVCIFRYYKMQNEKKRPLKFDHYMLRFRFAKKAAQMQILHEKGPMHISLKDLPFFMTRILNGEFSKKVIRVIREF
jgi:hypothetical protein